MSQGAGSGRGCPRGCPRGHPPGRGRGVDGRGGSNLADDAVIANPTETEASEMETPPDNVGPRATFGGPFNAPSDNESHLSDASYHLDIDIGSSPPLPRYPFPLGPSGSQLSGRPIHVPEGAEYEEHIVDASPPPNYENVGSPPARFQSSDDSGPPINTHASTSQHTSSPGPAIYMPFSMSQLSSSSGPAIHTPFSTSHLSSSSRSNINTPSSSSQHPSSFGPAIRTRSPVSQPLSSARTKVESLFPTGQPSQSSRSKVETRSSTSQPSFSSRIKVEPQSSPSQFTSSSSKTARPEPPSPERIRDSEEARSAKPRANRYPAPPPPFASSDAFQQLHNIDHPPPGYERRPAPAVRQGTETRWSYGVLSGGALINMLEDLSRSPQTEHERMCLWLQEHYTTPFGRFHTHDGLVIRSTEDSDMLCLAYSIWLEVRGMMVEGDVFFVPGLEPREIRDGWRNRSLGNLPGLPNGYGHKIWKAGDAQYREGTYLKEKKGTVVEEK